MRAWRPDAVECLQPPHSSFYEAGAQTRLPLAVLPFLPFYFNAAIKKSIAALAT